MSLHVVGEKKTIFFNSCDVSKSYSLSDLNMVIGVCVSISLSWLTEEHLACKSGFFICWMLLMSPK